MKFYEVTFIVDPVLSGDEIKATAKTYQEMLTNEGCSIIHVDEMGLKPLAYPINKRSSGIYFCIEFSSQSGSMISKLELALRRDERIMRFLTIGLDKYGVKYNEDKRNGLIGKAKNAVKAKKSDAVAAPAPAAAPAPKPAPTPVAAPAPVAAPEPIVASNEEE
jgi:small subunit ribosomal protein S6